MAVAPTKISSELDASVKRSEILTRSEVGRFQVVGPKRIPSTRTEYAGFIHVVHVNGDTKQRRERDE